MIFLYIVLGTFTGAYVGKFVSFITKELPPFLLEGGDDGKTARDLMRDFFRVRSCSKCRYLDKGWGKIPVVNYLLARGRCPNCLEPLSTRDFIIELSCTLSFGLTTLSFTFSPAVLFILFAGTLLACCFITDLEHGILPDQFTFSLVWGGIDRFALSYFCDFSGGYFRRYGRVWDFVD